MSGKVLDIKVTPILMNLYKEVKIIPFLTQDVIKVMRNVPVILIVVHVALLNQETSNSTYVISSP